MVDTYPADLQPALSSELHFLVSLLMSTFVTEVSDFAKKEKEVVELYTIVQVATNCCYHAFH